MSKRRAEDAEGLPSSRKKVPKFNNDSQRRDHAQYVKRHYNDIKEKSRNERNNSKIIVMRGFNNWIKQVQIESAFSELKKSAPENIFEKVELPPEPGTGNAPVGTKMRCKGLRVLDWCCGKGGDQSKWKKIPVKHIDFVDLSDVSVQECQKRYRNNRQCQDKYSAEFFVHDCTQKISNEKLDTHPYDIVSCQFAIHYAFESCEKATQIVKNISKRLKSGGLLIGTTVNDMELMARARQNISAYNDRNISGSSLNESSDSSCGSDHGDSKPIMKPNIGNFGNRIYQINFDPAVDLMRPPLFGCKYDFDLDGLITVPEFMVNRRLLSEICKQHGMELVYYQPFRTFFQERCKDDKYRYMLNVFKSLTRFNEKTYNFDEDVDEGNDYERPRRAIHTLKKKGEAEPEVGTMSLTDWEAVTLYSAFCFRKK